MRIYHCPHHGVHTDLDHVLEMDEPYFYDRMGRGGWYVGHSVRLALVDEPVARLREVRPSDAWYAARREKTWEGNQRAEELQRTESEAALALYRKEVWQPMYDAWTGLGTAPEDASRVVGTSYTVQALRDSHWNDVPVDPHHDTEGLALGRIARSMLRSPDRTRDMYRILRVTREVIV